MSTAIYDSSPPTIASDDLQISIGGGTSIIKYAFLKQKSKEFLVVVKKYRRIHKELAKAEVKYLQRLSNHRNIIGFYGIVEPEDEGLPDLAPPLIVLERANRSLKQYIEEFREHNKTPTEKVLYMSLIQIARGIQHMHEQGVAHLDIKPSNILITEEKDGVVFKLCDFGMSEDIYSDTRGKTEAKSVKGTFPYMAPEIHFKTPPEDTSFIRVTADIFSFSITIWELTLCKEPFAGMKDTQIILELSRVHDLPKSNKLPKGLPSLPTIGLPSPIRLVLTGCWQNYKHRWDMANILQTLGKKQ